MREEETMKNRGMRFAVVPSLLAAAVVMSCVTINIYFPAAAVEKAADRIVEETWGEKTPPPEKKKIQKEGFLAPRRWFPFLRVGVAAAWAQDADINVSTPGIRALKESIRKRAGALKPYLDRGNVGITRDGLLVMRSPRGIGLREKATLARLIKAENSDRMRLYREIARANNFSDDRVPDIQKIFSGSWIRQARKGWWVQEGDGKWHAK